MVKVMSNFIITADGQTPRCSGIYAPPSVHSSKSRNSVTGEVEGMSQIKTLGNGSVHTISASKYCCSNITQVEH